MEAPALSQTASKLRPTKTSYKAPPALSNNQQKIGLSIVLKAKETIPFNNLTSTNQKEIDIASAIAVRNALINLKNQEVSISDIKKKNYNRLIQLALWSRLTKKKISIKKSKILKISPPATTSTKCIK